MLSSCNFSLSPENTIEYDALGQLLRSSDPEGIHTSYRYDNLGRLIQRTHPDAGATHYSYDPAGNITKQITPLGEINFDYTYYPSPTNVIATWTVTMLNTPIIQAAGLNQSPTARGTAS